MRGFFSPVAGACWATVAPMSTQSLLLIGLAAVLVFWAVGAHNRLVRLSNAVAEAYPAVDAHLRERARLSEQWLALMDTLSAEQRAPLVEALQALRSALEALRLMPSSARALSRYLEASGRVEHEYTALSMLPSIMRRTATDPLWQQTEGALQKLDEQFENVSQSHRAAVLQFNEAVTEFPALLIARGVGLKPLPALPPDRASLVQVKTGNDFRP